MVGLVCKNCIYYHQHYILSEERCDWVNCGHCAYPRLKHRKPNDKACTNYQQRTSPQDLPDRQKVMHFLTKEMLRFILDLELPPEIGEEG